MDRPAVDAVSLVPERLRPYQGERAGFASRALANTVDFLIIVFTLIGIYLGAALTLFLWNPRTFQFPAPSVLVSTLIATSLATIYFGVEWMASGRTYGDHLL